MLIYKQYHKFILSKTKYFLILFLFIFINPKGLSSLENNDLQLNDNIQLSIDAKNKDSNLNLIGNEYILGPADSLLIKFSGIDMFSGIYNINFDGDIILPELQAINAEELTINELKQILNDSYKEYITNPNIEVTLIGPRPVNIYLNGAIRRRGLYSLEYMNYDNKFSESNKKEIRSTSTEIKKGNLSVIPKLISPKLIDALRMGEGLKANANISEIEIIRINPKKNGGGKIKTTISLIPLLTEGDQSQNIRLFDGDTIFIKKSDKSISKQINLLNQTNLVPGFIDVYVTGNVASSGPIKIPRGAKIMEAISFAGGESSLSGVIEFLRFSPEGDLTKRKFNISKLKNNPKIYNYDLMPGDIIRINKNIIGQTTSILENISSPLFTGYAFYEIFN